MSTADIICYTDVKEQFDAHALLHGIKKDDIVVPVRCGDARGVAGEDYTTKQGGGRPGPWDLYANPNAFDKCWYAMSKFRPLYPEYDDLSNDELTRKLYSSHGIQRAPNPWTAVGMWASIAFGIPLVVLILGASLVWAVSGFAAVRSK